jgi:hypothetical protein
VATVATDSRSGSKLLVATAAAASSHTTAELIDDAELAAVAFDWQLVAVGFGCIEWPFAIVVFGQRIAMGLVLVGGIEQQQRKRSQSTRTLTARLDSGTMRSVAPKPKN